MKKYRHQDKSSSQAINQFVEEKIDEARRKDYNLDKESTTVKNTIDLDIRENIPPQLMAIVSGLVEVIENIEKE